MPVRPYQELTSPAGSRVRSLLALSRRRAREAEGLTVIEGYEELTLALTAGVRPRALYFCPALVSDSSQLNTADRVAALGADVFRLSRPVFEKVAYRQSPDGWLAVVPTVPTGLDRLRLRPDPLILVCESVEKPGNLGAVLRTADAAGLDAVIAAGPVTDWGNPNLVRASKGTLFSVPVAAAGADEVLRWLKERAVTVVAATPDAEISYTELDLTGPTAISVGSEKYGLSATWLRDAHVTARIPMQGKVNSLNVATSAAIMVYEAIRQRTPTRH